MSSQNVGQQFRHKSCDETKKTKKSDDDEQNEKEDEQQQHQQQNEKHMKQQQQNEKQQQKKKKRSPLRSRCPRVAREVLCAALEPSDALEMMRIARSYAGGGDERGRIGSAALREAVNSNPKWIKAVHDAHARMLFTAVIDQ
jgi:hypothetical protein